MRESIEKIFKSKKKVNESLKQDDVDRSNEQSIGAITSATQGLTQPNPESLMKMATEAARRGEWHGALNAWKFFSQLDPKNPAGYLGQAEAHRGLHDALSADNALFAYTSADEKPAEFSVSFALNAQINEDWHEALLRWRAAKISHPEASVIWAGEAAMLQLLGRLDEADELTTEGISKFHDKIELHAQHCNVAVAAEHWIEAQQRWDEMVKLFPGHDHVLQNQDRIKQAIMTGLSTLTGEEVNNKKNSLEIWRTLYRHSSKSRDYIIGYGCALRETEEYDEAEKIFSRGLEILPNDVEIHANFAQVAAVRLNWETAAKRWEKTIELFPDVTPVWIMAAIAYREAGWLQKAGDLLDMAIEIEPQRPELHVHRAMTSERVGDWEKAVRSWDIAYQLRPDDFNIQNSRGDAIWQATMSGFEEDNSKSKTQKSKFQDPPEAEEDLKKLALSFEGLGDNCEFGIVQRRFGADPIGLFRFAAIEVTTLINLAKEKFTSLGRREFTELDLTASDEYLIRDTKNPYYMHCFVRKDTVEPDKFLAQQISRINFLKRKIIEDLDAAEKIFVYKSSYGITESEILELHDALCQYRHNTLLVVQKSSDEDMSGSIKILRPGALLGYVETLYNHENSPIDFTSWKKIMETSYRYKTLGHKLSLAANVYST